MDVISAGRPDGIPRRWRPRWARVARRRWPRAYLVAARVLVAAGVLAGAVALRAGAGGLWDPSVPVPDAPADAPFALLAQYGTDLVRYDYEGGDVRTRALPRRIAGNRVVPAEGWVTSGETVLVTEAGPGEVAAAVLSRGGRFERMLPDGVRVLPVPHGRGLWIVRADGPTGSTVQEYDLTGQPSGFAVPVPRSWRVSAALREVLVLSRPGEPALAFWTPGRGDPRPYPGGGRVVSAAPDAVLTECRPACGFTLLRPSGPAAAVLLPSGYQHAGDPVLSQDGAEVAAMAAPGDSRVLEVSLFAGPVPPGGPLRQVPGSRSRDLFAPQPAQQGRPVRPSWSVDGRLFGFAPGEPGLFRYRPAEGRIRSLGVSAPGVLTRLVAG